ncbi:hypothetical protein AAC387_Pa06g0508 [Persea americana]|eukprot:TRINITY_DN5396_c0_g1_i1.p1 TRINITY_DN5396_c0_g1~~TRINITY_DN5396_c0_g1_i1.p1  ORF type:complete len:241 (-),score=73.91 TRINITY_DN5396_c0_g1_i1:288-1010(-)
MDNMGCVQVRPAAPRKEKKKQPKDELDRSKQAEKKRRRLEKALATSAAIISELEKKKQKKKEELQRLDEEGAAIAEAVALQVLGDDQGDSCQIVLKKSDRFELDPWDHAGNIGVLMGGWRAGTTYQGFAKHPVERVGWVSDANVSECKWNGCEFGWSFTTGNEILRRDAVAPHFVERGQGAELSAGLMAAQAVSALQIADVHEDAFAGERRAAIVINGMMESGDLGKRNSISVKRFDYTN